MTVPAPMPSLEIRILFLEEHPDEVERALELLRRNEIDPQADVVQTLAAFKERLEAEDYDVIIADHDPDEVVEALQLRRKTIPLVLLRDYLGDETTVDGLRKGVMALVYKDRIGRLPSVVYRALQEKMLRDARLQAEAALRGANQVLTALIRCAPLPITVIDRVGTVNVWNPAAEEVLGWKKEEVLGKRLTEVLARGDSGLAATLLRSTDQGGLRGAELRQVRNDGASVDLRVFSAPLRDNENQMQGIIGMMTDITEMNLIVEAFRESRERFQTAFLHAPTGMAISSMEGRFMRVNPSFCKMFGYSEAELLRLSWPALIHPEDRSLVLSPNGEDATRQEIRMLCKPCCVAYVLWSASVVRDGSGRPQYIISQLIDITGIKHSEHIVRQYAANLERSNSDLQHFAYVASHDLQEPLRMIRGFLELLAKRYKGKLDQAADEYIAYAVDGAARMQNLIRGLLAYSRVGTQGGSFTAVDVENTLSQALLNLQVALQESEAQVTHDPLPVVPGDETQLAQLFQNLVGNAIKFRSESSPKIHVRADDMKDMWEFAVTDNGIGFNPEHANRIFQMFQRLHGPTKYPGTGIGLALCKRIVERHGGRIWVDSAPEQGSTFFFSIPKEAQPNGCLE